MGSNAVELPIWTHTPNACSNMIMSFAVGYSGTLSSYGLSFPFRFFPPTPPSRERTLIFKQTCSYLHNVYVYVYVYVCVYVLFHVLGTTREEWEPKENHWASREKRGIHYIQIQLNQNNFISNNNLENSKSYD